MARCYTPTFPYQRHFDGYVEMSEEDAALFWEIGNNYTPDVAGSHVGPTLADRAFSMPEEAVPKTTMSPKPVSNGRPDDPQCTDVCARPAGDSRDTKPTDPALLGPRAGESGGLIRQSFNHPALASSDHCGHAN